MPSPDLTQAEGYDAAVAPMRARVTSHPGVRALLDPALAPAVLERFLIEWCALGVQLTEPVEGWIRRAGERCQALGLTKVGAALLAHAKHEANHHLMFERDTRALVARWNTRHRPGLDAEALMARPATPAMQRYIDLHERNITGSTPFAQVAIEYEVEGLSVSLLPALFAQFERLLGPEILASLTFLKEHAEIDVGHTAFNRRAMATLLAARPEARAHLAEIGGEAVSAYLDFFTECLAVAEAEVGAPS